MSISREWGLPRRTALPAVGLGLLIASLLFALLPLTLALALTGAAILLPLLVAWPDTVLYLLVMAVPFGSLLPLPVGGANVTAADLLLGLALALWAASGIARRRIVVRPASLVLPFFIFLFAAGLSVTRALSLQASVKELVKWGEMLATYWLVVQMFSSPGSRSDEGDRRTTLRLILLASAFLLAGLAQALVGFYQYFFNAGPEGFVLGGGLRAYGTFDQPNPYAGYLGLIIPVAFGVVLVGVRDVRKIARSSNLALFALALVSLGAMLGGLFFSLSRGALLGVAAALAVMVMISSKRAALVGVSAALLIAAAALLGQLNLIPDVVSSRFAGVADYVSLQDVRDVKVTDANYAIVERMAHWQAGLAMFEANPWLGVGFGNYAVVYPAFSLPHWDDPLGHAHNYYINVLAESGIIGLAGYGVLWVCILLLAWRAVRATNGLMQGLALGAFGALVALSIHNLFDNLFVHSMQMQIGLTLGMIEIILRRSAL